MVISASGTLLRCSSAEIATTTAKPKKGGKLAPRNPRAKPFRPRKKRAKASPPAAAPTVANDAPR